MTSTMTPVSHWSADAEKTLQLSPTAMLDTTLAALGSVEWAGGLADEATEAIGRLAIFGGATSTRVVAVLGTAEEAAIRTF
eukprot:COSAG01_NODE_54895_length_329_cov_0.626087_1_plen_80_part_10